MAATKVVVYGLSTEGYSIACQMAIKGADVFIVDESAHMAISLKAEIAKTYPNVTSLKEDEPLLGVEPIDVAISHAEYLFFAPRIRKTGQEAKMEIHSKFKDATSPMKKGGSVIYNLPTGIGGNNETISLLEHITGLEMGKGISYFYYPLSKGYAPEIIGSFNGKLDDKLGKLLETEKKQKKFASMASAEIIHAIKVLTQFSSLSSILEVCKFVQDAATRNDLVFTEYKDLFLDDMTNGLYDLRSLGTSVEGAGTMMYLVNGSIKGIEGYVKRLIDEIRSTLKKNELKASRTKVVLVWTQDSYEMRGDKVDMLNSLVTKLRDYIGDVEVQQGPGLDLFHSDKTTIIVACSKLDYDKVAKNGKDSDVIIIKTNPLCEIL
ncbi:MAG: hypothetical protein KGI25_02640 [Thaumarchaeota archaeon]|nr:hypothetical protein [Nitrososphaerota archaeon]